MNPLFNGLTAFLKKFGRKGQGAIEFAVIIPTLFIFFYAVLEFSLLFIHDQRVSALSREISNATFRDCGGFKDKDLRDCVEDIVDEVASRADGILRNCSGTGRVIVSVYGPDPNDSTGSPPAVTLLATEAGGGVSFPTEYSAIGMDSAFVFDQGLVVVGEAFYPYQPITPIKQLIDPVLPTELYEATIY